jgi:hypothetical protein
VSDDDRLSLEARLRLARLVREEYRELEKVNPDVAKQLDRLVWRDAVHKANELPEKYSRP